jgi:hypothetical protein
MLNKTKFILLAALMVTLFGSGRAFACSCMMPEGPLSKLVADAKQSSHAIFTGKVLKTTPNPGAQKFQDQYLSIELQVIDVFKGNVTRRVTIRTGSSDGNCKFPFKVNQTYLIYAENSTMYSQAEMLSTGICSRTAALIKARSDLRYLGKPRKPKNV